jgi:hypothetical protein
MSSDLLSYDIVARRRPDGLYDLKQHIRDADVPLEGPLKREKAEARARELAQSHRTNAWVEEINGPLRLLATR